MHNFTNTCKTAVKNPVGKVNPESQNFTGGDKVVCQVVNWSTLWTKSRLHDPNGFNDV